MPDDMGLVIERLRYRASTAHTAFYTNLADHAALDREAAAAIERLLAERDEARTDSENERLHNAELFSRAFDAEAQRDKLKEALTKIDAAFQNAVRGSGNFERDLGWTGSNDNMGEIFAWFARQALEDSP